MSGWDAARRSERRGFVQWPTLDTSKELSAHERMETMRKVRAGEANVGFVKRAISGTARMVGVLTPQANTTDHEWNREAERAFWSRARHPRAFDLAGKVDFYGWQLATLRSKYRDGDALTVLASGHEDAGRVMFYEAHQVGDGRWVPGRTQPKALRDGVYLDRWGGRAAFRVLGEDEKSFQRVERDQCIYHCRAERTGRPREVSGLAHAVSNFLDMVEIIADTKHAVKVAALWGVAMETAAAAGAKGNAPTDELRQFLDHTASAPDEAGTGEVLTLDRIVSGGRVQGLPVGAKLATLQDSRPHPNQIALLAWLVRDMAHGLGLPPEILWDISGLNGTGMRYAMAEARRFVEMEQMDLQRDCERVWTYFLAKEMKAGRLRRPAEDAGAWWLPRWIPQADMTIDRGREGMLELKQLEQGAITRAEMWGRRGKDWEDAERQLVREEIRREEIAEEEWAASGRDRPVPVPVAGE